VSSVFRRAWMRSVPPAIPWLPPRSGLSDARAVSGDARKTRARRPSAVGTFAGYRRSALRARPPRAAPGSAPQSSCAGQPVHPRQISFTAARRAVIASTRSGAATASLPAALSRANRDAILGGLARRRIDVDRNRHRDRTTKARPAFPPGGPRLTTLTATRRDQHLRRHRRLIPGIAPSPSRGPAGPWNRPPARSDSRAAGMPQTHHSAHTHPRPAPWPSRRQ
jgi:hypothetical protein